MSDTPTTLTEPAWPLVTVTIDDDGRAVVNRLGTVHTLTHDTADAARDGVRSWIAEHIAALTQRPVPVTITDPAGLWHVLIGPDGTVTPSDHGKDRENRRHPRAVPDLTTETEPAGEPVATAADTQWSAPLPPPTADDTASTGRSATAHPHTSPIPVPTTAEDVPAEGQPETPSAPSSGSRGRHATASRSFLPDTVSVDPAQRGWRGFLAQLGFRTGPSAAELAEREDQQAISQHWPGPRSIAVVNGKGGAGKTPSTAVLAALFARAGGSGVLAWDNNETRGTLGWRTEQGPHEAHVHDLLPHAEELLAPTARAADLAAYLHHQRADKYDVLRSNPNVLAAEQRLTEADFDAIHRLSEKYFRLMLIDSGNDESAPHWLRMVDKADQLVVPTTTRVEHAEAARLLLDALRDRDQHCARLADNAVVIVSQADRHEKDAATIAAGFDGLARAAVTVPYDHALSETWLRLDALSPASRRAWLASAAEIARGL